MDRSLTVLAHQLALIPTGGEYEVLCHEFKCQNASGGHVLVYVDAADGRRSAFSCSRRTRMGRW